MQSLFLSAQYLRYLFISKGAHGIHSSFVYSLYNEVIKENRNFYEFQPIERLRRELLYSDKTIEVTDFGAGGQTGESMPHVKHTALVNRQVREIARRSSVSPKKGRMLFRLVNFLQPGVMVELGTSLGVSTLYQFKGRPEATLYTLEGSAATAEIARDNFRKLNASSIVQVVGNFEDTLPPLLNKLPSVDYVFFDGNHRKEATLEYFYGFLPRAADNTVFIFDDIRWSRGMYEAWIEIIKDKKATVTIDLFTFGIIFFRRQQAKQHFVVKF